MYEVGASRCWEERDRALRHPNPALIRFQVQNLLSTHPPSPSLLDLPILNNTRTVNGRVSARYHHHQLLLIEKSALPSTSGLVLKEPIPKILWCASYTALQNAYPLIHWTGQCLREISRFQQHVLRKECMRDHRIPFGQFSIILKCQHQFGFNVTKTQQGQYCSCAIRDIVARPHAETSPAYN